MSERTHRIAPDLTGVVTSRKRDSRRAGPVQRSLGNRVIVALLADPSAAAGARGRAVQRAIDADTPPGTTVTRDQQRYTVVGPKVDSDGWWTLVLRSQSDGKDVLVTRRALEQYDLEAAAVAAPQAQAQQTGPPAPASADEVRAKMQGFTPASFQQAGTFLAARINELQNLGLSHTHASVDALAAAYAAGTNNVTAEAAKAEILENKTRALTLPTDHYHQLGATSEGIAAATRSDEIHEFVHICSHPGGLSQLKADSNNLNEGVVQLFTHHASAALRVDVQAAYTGEDMYPRAQRIAKAISPASLWKACFQQGGVAALGGDLGEWYKRSNPNAKAAGKLLDAAGWGAEFVAKLKANNSAWLKTRLPPA